MRRFLVVASLVAVAACAGATVRTLTAANVELIATARDDGAQRCAPVELAMAESHNDYASHALDEGNYYDARKDADVAEKNARRAIEKSPKDKCNPKPNLDTDGDGILDDKDQCINEPEDKDGFQDDDGCPDTDNAKDGIADKDDTCPNEFGVPPDGCPKKYTLVVVTDKKIEIKQTVYFDFNKATIKPVSFELLNQVAQALTDNPKIKVEVGGHTDSIGDDNYNLKLSQKRAESVKAYIVKRGIDAGRMDPKGYGENVPIADNRTKEGRDQNRRVEFVITEH